MPIRVLACWPQPPRRQKHGWMLSQSLLLAWEWTMKLSGLKWGFTLDCLHVDPTSAVSVDTHGVSCQFSKGCHPRHAAVNDVLKRSLTGGSKDPITSRAIWHLQSWRQTTRWSVHRSMETGQSPGVGFHMPRHFGPLLRTPCNKRSRSCGNRDGAQEEHEVYPPERHSPLCPHSKWNLWDDGTRSKALLSGSGQGITAATLDPLSNQHLLQRVSIAVQHGNAAALLGTLPQGSLRS